MVELKHWASNLQYNCVTNEFRGYMVELKLPARLASSMSKSVSRLHGGVETAQDLVLTSSVDNEFRGYMVELKPALSDFSEAFLKSPKVNFQDDDFQSFAATWWS